MDAGPSARELRQMLSQRGVSTAGIFERDELLRLVEELPLFEEPDIPPLDALIPVEEMSVQELMFELEERGIDCDVLAPEPALRTLLTAVRAGKVPPAAPPEVVVPPPSPVPTSTIVTPPPSDVAAAPPAAAARCAAASAHKTPPPSSSSRGGAAAGPAGPGLGVGEGVGAGRPRRTTRGASEHTELLPLVGDAVNGFAEWITPTVNSVVEAVTPAAAAAANATASVVSGDPSGGGRLLSSLRQRLTALKVHRPPKLALLALCCSALRFGFVRTALVALCIKLSVEILQEAAQRLRSRPGESTPSGSTATSRAGRSVPRD
jgi:hypothetical protein